MKAKRYIVWCYLGFILLGAALLALPCATPDDCPRLPFFDALFTATSAMCITGLTVIDPGSQLSPFGIAVLVALVQVGCVGIMTLGTFLLVCTGQRLSLQGEFSLSDAYGVKGVKGLRGLVVWVVVSLLVFETLGACAFRVASGTDWWSSFFYAAMAFCNAGFSLDAGSLAPFAKTPAALFVLAALVMIGGFGFFVVYNVVTIRWWRRNLVKRGRPSLHTRVVVYTSLALVAATFAFILAVEWNGALASVGDWTHRLAVAFFQAVTPRTCGFTVIPTVEFTDATRFFIDLMMFVGAGPGGAGGGVKVTTFVVFFAVIAALARGRRDVVISKRTIADDIVRESILIFFLYGAIIAGAVTVLLLTETGNPALPFENLFFETVSAVSTTGLSVGDTTRLLSPAGRVVIMGCMFLGRLGALTTVLLVAGREDPQSIRYPKEEIVVG